MQFDDVWEHAGKVDRAYSRLSDITRRTPWEAVRRGEVSDADRAELRSALEEARGVVAGIAGDPDLWSELWTVPNGFDVDERTNLVDQVQMFRRSLNGLCNILGGGQRVSWIGTLDLLDSQKANGDAPGGTADRQEIDELRADLLSWSETARAAVESADLFAEFRAASGGTERLEFLGELTLAGAALALTVVTGGAAAPFLGVGQVVLGGVAHVGYRHLKHRRDRKRRIDHFEDVLTAAERGALLTAIGKWAGKAESLRALRSDGEAADEIVEDLQRACDVLFAHRDDIAFFEQLDASFDRGAQRDDVRDRSARARVVVTSLVDAVGRLDRAGRGVRSDDDQWERAVGDVEALFDELADIIRD
jgi:hypothetical protein